MTNPVVNLEIERRGLIKIELYPDIAPNTVNNFLSLVKKGYYDGLTFHRVIKGFMIQGGCPNGTGVGGPGYSIKGEFSSNGHPNKLKHEPGVISMARAMDPNSAGSQFFLMTSDSPHLDGQYAAFGKIVEGIEIAMDIEKVKTGFGDKPKEVEKIAKATLDTFGVEYPEPEKI
ncbi:MAG: peptidylprolyl isomerase [Filifactoraceae bacterium]